MDFLGGRGRGATTKKNQEQISKEDNATTKHRNKQKTTGGPGPVEQAVALAVLHGQEEGKNKDTPEANNNKKTADTPGAQKITMPMTIMVMTMMMKVMRTTTLVGERRVKG